MIIDESMNDSLFMFNSNSNSNSNNKQEHSYYSHLFVAHTHGVVHTPKSELNT